MYRHVIIVKYVFQTKGIPTKSKMAILSTKVTIKVTESLTLPSFQRVSIVKYAYQYEVSISYISKVKTKVKVFTTDRQDKHWMPIQIPFKT